PGKQPELSGVVKTSLPRTAKILAEVHSETSPRSFNKTTSSKPFDCASSTSVRFVAQERILVPAKGEAAWRPCGAYASFTPAPQSCRSAVKAIRSVLRSQGLAQ